VTLGARHFVGSVVCLLLLQLVCLDSISAPKVGVLWQVASPVDTSLFEGLRELGYTPGRDILIDWRITDSSSEKIRSLALDLIRTNSDIIVTGGTVVTRETLAVNKQIPVVFVAGDPVGTGFVKSLAEPAGNATGVSSGPTDLTGKRLELLQMLTPRARHIGYLRNPSNPAQDLSFQEVLRVAQSLKIRIEPLTASNSSDLGQVLRDLRGQRLDAILVSGQITFFKGSSGFRVGHEGRV
jgi:ABC-type uncharacterized transport system substrate-binding protein